LAARVLQQKLKVQRTYTYGEVQKPWLIDIFARLATKNAAVLYFLRRPDSQIKRAPRSAAIIRSHSRRPVRFSIGFGDYCITLPPWALQLTTSVDSVQPWPLQEFWPLQDDDAVLQALVPLHELTPLHFTPA
jgi:hypothetical protein